MKWKDCFQLLFDSISEMILLHSEWSMMLFWNMFLGANVLNGMTVEWMMGKWNIRKEMIEEWIIGELKMGEWIQEMDDCRMDDEKMDDWGMDDQGWEKDWKTGIRLSRNGRQEIG